MSPGTELRSARLRAGLSQRQLAQRARVPQSTVGRIEAGLIDPRASTFDRLLQCCGYELEVQARLGLGIDRTQLRELLRLSPRRRIEWVVVAAENVARLVKLTKGRL